MSLNSGHLESGHPPLTSYFCVTCGTQFAPAAEPPAHCPVCEDVRQFVPREGQAWTTGQALTRRHRNAFEYEAEHLLGIGTTPTFAIGQRALLVQARSGNVLWDAISLVDEATRRIVRGLGGLSAIAISHPHYYSGMVDWSRAFDEAPIYLHQDDQAWVMYPHPNIRFWSGDTLALADDLTLVRCGGHFAGGTVLHWAAPTGRGVLLSGDVLQVAQDHKYVSFMYSYPNYIPLPAARVQKIADILAPWRFDEVYGAWWGRAIRTEADRRVRESAERYVAALQHDGGP